LATRCSALRLALIAGLCASGHSAQSTAAGLDVVATDKRGEPVTEVVVYVERIGAAPAPVGAADRAPAVMNQLDRAFVPHVLVVEAGTPVSFPNDDSVSHHVYSFSPAKRFELPLYKGSVHPPQVFPAPGVVVLGCNIHDHMLGYVFVVDTPYFTMTDEMGRASFDGLPAGNYELRVWTPRARHEDLPEGIAVHLQDAGRQTTRVAFTSKLFPPHDGAAGSLSWKLY
jgi:plastocyanin